MDTLHPPLLSLVANRVRRNYRGGALLEQLAGRPAIDSDQPEDWIASTVRASNPGMREVPDEGLAVVVDARGQPRKLVELFAEHPGYYLGPRHPEHAGSQLGFLVKLLDSAMRLSLQAHPTSTFARKHLGSQWGKLEAYVILAVRPGVETYILLGFQRPPSAQEWLRIVMEQDLAAMERCFDRIPVREGEVWLVPGGMPHAIGEGILLLEVMEPSDLVVRCEFEREGFVVPPPARFMQMEPARALQIFDYESLSVDQVIERYRIPPQRLTASEELLIGSKQSDSFSVRRIKSRQPVALDQVGHIRIGVVTTGSAELTIGEGKIELMAGSRFLVPALAPAGLLTPTNGTQIEVLMCSP